MSLKYFISGFLVKMLAGFDDTLVRIPICANVTRTKKGRFAFATGTLFAISLAVVVSILFGSLIKSIKYHHYISAGLILILAFSVYFDWFKKKQKEKAEKIKKSRKIEKIQKRSFGRLIIIGFFVSLVTIIDDTIAYSALFLGAYSNIPFIVLGLFFATLLQLGVMIYFAEKVVNFKYKKEVTFAGLLLLAVLVLKEVL